MTLEFVDELLRWVGAVVIGWHEFQFVFVFIHNNFLERLGTFIVHFWTAGRRPRFSKWLKYLGILGYVQKQNGFSLVVQ